MFRNTLKKDKVIEKGRRKLDILRRYYADNKDTFTVIERKKFEKAIKEWADACSYIS